MKGFHITTMRAFKKIQENGLKGSQWEEDFSSSYSNPFDLSEDGAVFCFPSLEKLQENLCYFDDDYEVVLELEGEGVAVDHEAEGLLHVLRADTCEILSQTRR